MLAYLYSGVSWKPKEKAAGGRADFCFLSSQSNLHLGNGFSRWAGNGRTHGGVMSIAFYTCCGVLWCWGCRTGWLCGCWDIHPDSQTAIGGKQTRDVTAQRRQKSPTVSPTTPKRPKECSKEVLCVILTVMIHCYISYKPYTIYYNICSVATIHYQLYIVLHTTHDILYAIYYALL